jgi:hypothetical protein
MAHTPGPWTWVSNGTALIGSNEDQVLAIDLPEFIEPENKALLAAAPELLAALKGLADSQGERHDGASATCRLCEKYYRANSAIAKAEGR